MDTVTIGTTTYDSYSSQANADTYLAASIWATDWNAPAADNTKGAALVTATRWMDEATWDTAYNTQALRFAEAPIVQACQELAALLVGDANLRSSMLEPQIRSMKADTVQLQYFRPADVQISTFFPTRVMALLAPYLASNDVLPSSIAYGTSTETAFADTYARRSK